MPLLQVVGEGLQGLLPLSVVAGWALVFTGIRNGNLVLLVRGGVGYTLSYLGELPANTAAKNAIDRVLTSFKLNS